PMQIVEDDDERRLGGERFQRFGDLSEHALRRCAEDLVLQRLALLDQGWHLGQPRRSVAPEQRDDALPAPKTREATRRVENRQVRFGTAHVLEALTPRDPHVRVVLLYARYERVDHAGLADPAFADDEHHLTATTDGARERR